MRRAYFNGKTAAAAGLFLFLMICPACAQVPDSPREVEFQYLVHIKGIPEDARNVRVWFPVVQNTPLQDVRRFEINPEEGPRMTSDDRFGNEMIYLDTATPETKDLQIFARYQVKRSAFVNRPDNPYARNEKGREDLKRFLLPDRLVPVNAETRQLASLVTGGKTTSWDKARAIYDYVIEHTEFSRKVPGWGYGNAERIILLKTGDSTDFHSLFIALCRSSGIPAKFIIGVDLPTREREFISSYYAWAEFHDETLGWVPVDIARAKATGQEDAFFGAVDANRLQLSHGRDIRLEPEPEGGPLNFFVYPYVEVDGRLHRDLTVTLKHKDIP